MPVGVPATPAALRFKLADIEVVASGAASAPTGTVMFPTGRFVSRTPFTWFHPCTRSPDAVVSWPWVFTSKLPPRVYSVFPVTAAVTTKNPSPWIAASMGPPVDCNAPCEKFASVIGVPTPNPTWVAPRPAPIDCVTRL